MFLPKGVLHRRAQKNAIFVRRTEATQETFFPLDVGHGKYLPAVEAAQQLLLPFRLRRLPPENLHEHPRREIMPVQGKQIFRRAARAAHGHILLLETTSPPPVAGRKLRAFPAKRTKHMATERNTSKKPGNGTPLQFQRRPVAPPSVPPRPAKVHGTKRTGLFSRPFAASLAWLFLCSLTGAPRNGPARDSAGAAYMFGRKRQRLRQRQRFLCSAVPLLYGKMPRPA